MILSLLGQEIGLQSSKAFSPHPGTALFTCNPVKVYTHHSPQWNLRGEVPGDPKPSGAEVGSQSPKEVMPHMGVVLFCGAPV